MAAGPGGTTLSAMEHIYIVDDDEDIRDSLRLLLEWQPGMAVSTYANGAAFLEAADGLEPGVVLLDYHMPGLTGLDVLKTLRERQLHLSTVIITAHEDVNIAVKALEEGACDFLEKPYEYESLQVVLRIAFAELEQKGSTRGT